MKLAIRKLQGKKRPTRREVDEFIASHSFPLAEGTSVTFVYRGKADAVLLQHFIFGLPTSQEFQRISGTDLWFLVMELPQGSRVEYKLNIVRGKDHNWIRDPLNPHLARDPFGANSVVYATGYERPSWTFHDAEARAGEILERSIRSDALNRDQPYKVYLPARFRTTRRYPLLIVHDGDDYLTFSGLKTVLDNLIHRLEVAPLIAVLINSPRRLVEFADDPAHARFLTEELVPRIEQDYPLTPSPSARGLMGASFGGVASLSTAWRYPGRYGRLLLQSGSFGFTDIGHHHRGPAFDPVVTFVNAFRDNPGRPSERVFQSCGTYESLIYENRSMVPLFQRTGMEIRYVEARDGHNWENWRDRLREGLSYLFPGPLMMVYE